MNQTPLPTTIAEVLAELDGIIAYTSQHNLAEGIFAYLYRRTTAQIQAEIDRGAFADNERMAAFDVFFANHYLRAYRAYLQGQPLSQAWQVAFDACRQPLTVAQHLALGMNAHINLDLGLSAAEFMQHQPLHDLEQDFKKVNDVLFALTREMQERLGRVSSLIYLLDWVGERTDEQLANFSIKQARGLAWLHAQQLWALDGETRQQAIARIDATVAKLGVAIQSPRSRLLGWVLRAIRWGEVKEVGRVINLLGAD